MLRLSRAFCAVLLSAIYFSGILMASTAKADEGTDAYNAMQVAAKNCDRAAYNKNLATLENLRDGTKDSVKKLVYQTMLDNLPAYNCPPKSAALPFPGWIPTLPGALGVISRDPAPKMKRPGAYEWTGFYVGAQGGIDWTKGNWTTTEVISLGGRDPLVDQLKSLYKADPLLGLYMGYLFSLAQFFDGFDSWFFGSEFDVDYMNAAMDPGIPGTGAIGTAAVRGNDSVTVRAKWDMALRARLGYLATPSTLLFVAGGPAWLHMDSTVNCTAAGVCGTNLIPAFTQTNSTTQVGWTLGGGVEQQLWGRLHGRLEYRYSDYGKWSTSFGTPANLFVGSDIKLHTQSVMAGLVYAFGGL
jgi:outer membrane immunogenic protein